MKQFIFICITFFSAWIWQAEAQSEAPRTFREAKITLKKHVFHDQNRNNGSGDLYCGCSWEWTGESGGRMNLGSCGYESRSRTERANRMEWEHIVPASWFGRQLQCWQNGGRENCQSVDPLFSAMEADMHNLYPAVGEVNGDRSDFSAFILPASQKSEYGQCPTKVDFKSRVVDPRPEVRGLIARVHFYMAGRYNLRLSDQQQRVLAAWDRQYPPTAWEVERDRRVARFMGTSNPYVTRQKVWGQQSNYVYPNPVNVNDRRPSSAPSVAHQSAPVRQTSSNDAPIYGNRSSGIYHLRGVCPGYDKINPNNRVPFVDEQTAQNAGYRKAGNCK